MDEKPRVELNGDGDELKRLRLENQGLFAQTALVKRIRGQRDEAEDRFAN